MAIPQVRGLVAGRTLLYPRDGDVTRAVDQAAAIVADKPKLKFPSRIGGGSGPFPSPSGEEPAAFPSSSGGEQGGGR